MELRVTHLINILVSVDHQIDRAVCDRAIKDRTSVDLITYYYM